MKSESKIHQLIFLIHRWIFLEIIVLFSGCEPISTGFEEIENAKYYESSNLKPVQDTFSSIKIMTWNIRFAAGRILWFGDACGGRVLLEESEVYANLNKIADKINEIQPDILLLQEVDINSKRSAYVDQLQWILDHTYFNYAVYGSQWKSQFIPSDGLGRMDEGNAILSRWKLLEGQRIDLGQRNDQSGLVKYFYERCCIVKAFVELPGAEKLYILNIHASAFATDDTKYKHLLRFKSEMDILNNSQLRFVSGGDLNTLPPGSDTTDYCIQDACDNESFHNIQNNPMHKDGSNYSNETDWLTAYYRDYQPAIPLDKYLANQYVNFTHTIRPDHFWDRTLDYLFTNFIWVENSGTVRQEAIQHADHAPVMASLRIPK